MGLLCFSTSCRLCQKCYSPGLSLRVVFVAATLKGEVTSLPGTKSNLASYYEAADSRGTGCTAVTPT